MKTGPLLLQRNPKGPGYWPTVSAGRPRRKTREQRQSPSSGTPGHGMRPEQVPSLPWVSVSSSVEGTGLPHLQGALWHSVLQGQPWRAHHCRTVVLLLCLSLGCFIHNPGTFTECLLWKWHHAKLAHNPSRGTEVPSSSPFHRCKNRGPEVKHLAADPRVKQGSQGLKPGLSNPEAQVLHSNIK